MNWKKKHGDYLISTVSLSNAYEFDGKYPMGKYETMIKWKDKWLDYQERYDFEEDAKTGHQRAILIVMEGKI